MIGLLSEAYSAAMLSNTFSYFVPLVSVNCSFTLQCSSLASNSIHPTAGRYRKSRQRVTNRAIGE